MSGAPMTVYDNRDPYQTVYLNKLVPFSIPSNTAGQDVTIVMGPDTPNTYWVPKLVRIALSSDTIVDNTDNRTPSAQLYLGAATSSNLKANAGYNGNVLNSGILLDSTRDGLRDATGIVSGMIMSYGDQLVITWRNVRHAIDSNGNPVGGSAFVQVLGVYTNMPPSLAQQFLPETAGPRFNGAPIPDVNYSPTMVAPFAFDIPGPNNVQLVSNLTGGTGGAVKLGVLEWDWTGSTVTASQVSGSFVIQNGGTPSTPPPPTSTTLLQGIYQQGFPGYFDFRGLVVAAPGTGGLQLLWKQSAGAADTANSIVGTGALTYTPFVGQ